MQLAKKINNITIKWTDKKELLFINDKKKAMVNFHKTLHKGHHPTYFDCGFARYTEKVLNDTDIKRLRNKLLEKVIDGQKLTEQETKYLELTSETLNMFLEKEDFQKATRMLDPDFTDYVRNYLTKLEAAVAEDILGNYFSLRKKLKDARNEYLVKKTRESRRTGLSTSQEVSRSETLGTSAHIELSRSKQRAYKSQITRFLSKQTTTESPNGSSSPTQERVLKDRPKSAAIATTSSKKPGVSLRQQQHRNHPPSRVINDQYKHIDPQKLSKSLVIASSRQEQSFRLYTRDAGLITRPDMFAKFVSGGPVSRLKGVHKPTREQMIRAAIVIQKNWRGFVIRRRFAKYSPGYNKLLMDKRLGIRSTDPMGRSLDRQKSDRKKTVLTVNEKARMNQWRFQRIAVRQKFGDRSSSNNIQGGNHTDYTFSEECKYLLEACAKNQLEKITMLGFTILRAHTRHHDFQDNSPLYYAAKHRNSKLCSILLEKGADPNDTCLGGNTPFHLACVGNNKHVSPVVTLAHQDLQELRGQREHCQLQWSETS